MLALSLLSLLSLVAARAVPAPVPSLNKIVEALDARAEITTQQFDALKFYIEYASASYCNSEKPAGSPLVCGGASGNCPDLEADAVTIVGSWVGKLTGTGAFVSVDHARKEIVFAVRGSNNIRNWLTDVTFAFQDCKDIVADCKVHTGFAAAWNEIDDDVISTVHSTLNANPGYSIIATGHSLGAAVATIAAAKLRQSGLAVDLYTYGSPRVGNAAFATFVTNQPGKEFRVTHVDDPVPRLPPMLLGYRHVSPEYWLSDGTATTVNYSVNDVKVCTGIATTGCNAGTSVGLDVDAHTHYFQTVGSCDTKTGISWRDVSTPDISDEDLANRLSAWAVADQKYASTL